MSKLECPYCGNEKDEYDPQGPGDYQETQCHSCEKYYIYHVEYEPYYTTQQAPCLNGEKHDWEKIIGHPKEYFANRRRCSHCNEEVVLEEADLALETKKEIRVRFTESKVAYRASTSIGEKCLGCNEYDCRCADYSASSLR